MIVLFSELLLLNMCSSEDKIINDDRILMTIESSGYEPFLSLSNSAIQLPYVFAQRCKNRANPCLTNCQRVYCKRSSVPHEGYGFSRPEPIRRENFLSLFVSRWEKIFWSCN